MSVPIRAAAAVTGLILVAAIAFAILHASGGANLPGVGSGPSPLAATGPSAPDFTGIVDWENSSPLTISALRGKVILVDFWTYSCINCQRTIPTLRQWWQRYRDQGFVIVGVHTPEFEFEKDLSNIRRAIKDDGVEWPVAVDSKMATWNAYSNNYWPAEYLIDAAGHIRHTHFGEGEYDATERDIRALLAENGHAVSGPVVPTEPGTGAEAGRQTGETYAGSDRSDHSIRLQGPWRVQREYAELPVPSGSDQDYAEITYQARRVFLVAGTSEGPVIARLTLDGHDLTPANAGKAVGFDGSGHSQVVIEHHDLYALVALPEFGHHVLRVSPGQAGLHVFTFTFGS